MADLHNLTQKLIYFKIFPMKPGEIIKYQTLGSQISIDVKLGNEIIWLNQKQIAELFRT